MEYFFRTAGGFVMLSMDAPALRRDSFPGGSPGLNERSDEELMLAFQKGDTEAFETLLTRHEKGLYGFALRMVGERLLAEEIAQESFLRVIQSASRYREKAGFRNYLYRIARNLCIDLLRKRPREPRTPDLDPGAAGTPEGIPDGNPGPENHVVAAQVRTAIHRALAALPADQREAFLLKEVKGMKLQDVAAITGANLNTVKSRLRYALLRLREQLSRAGIEEHVP